MTVTESAARCLYTEFGRTLIIRPAEGEDTDALFEEVCANFENNRIEQDTDGNVYIMAPTGGESSDQNADITAQLRVWAKHDGRGRCFDSGASFILPDRSRLGPDAAWVSNEKLKTLSKADRKKFLRLVPEFVIELKSPSDRFSVLQRKMQDWMRNGVALGWLLHPDKQSVSIYRHGSPEVEVLEHATELHGEGPVSGFILDLKPIWQGLDFLP